MQRIFQPQKWAKTLPLVAFLSLSVSACSTPLSTDPINTRLNLSALPPIEGPQNVQTAAAQIFSFRIITPVKNVDIFSILQTIKPAGITLRQAALPVSQLKEVQAAKQIIENSAFVDPGTANRLAFDTARFYNWDIEVARQVMVEVVKIYTTHRDLEVAKWRKATEASAQKVIARAKAKQDEITKQDQDLYKRIYNPKPGINDRNTDNPGVKRYIIDSADRLEKNHRAQAEYQRQAKAAQEKYLEELKVKLAEDRKKAELEAKLRDQRVSGLIKTQSIDSEAPFHFYTLHNGDFMIETGSAQALPPVIQLKVDGFELPISIPILAQTHNGRLLVSIDADAQGRPVVRGGMDDSSGGRFDLQAPVFTLKYGENLQQELSFLYPDGKVETLDIGQLSQLSRWDQQPQLLPPRVTQLDPENLRTKLDAFAQISYQFIPVISDLPPDQALDLLQTVQSQF
ncbi:hypothetical protein COW36_20290 [bacterium (Candidatus Blackallbacteria) CG17_big_fil_post_rev_8_21_14_2_50_48_46]|uniref:DUF4398 domain-containing protein n=1 Tax=bacterium (Candidatus Blackallbacteria) CG17_big_fil_post_rev_8_21_14_2_50_48_46 TaxID=2014261 RepID=A0A2M7FZB4_9BACT|nr:MAG: hypothetical protein COW64_22615 [bacterium (Candidatus Blackallbacteria) CG18_big_fil_WC_8_21_14_2_50_49_26]PIW14746.1 MAG: hypothetical protein COW36_20290 [bacterium (Candidatus Blackallbacteria) CG17_big_fil_post_rev_8_21_14_2_50_48_46]PIW50848.1 MAG: hypothetical protein COW20_01105 [bacterium (Candidatus Blackallbacteria) CG13_big_fil_rev_8_21_14_2_50_49_14]